jgi:hypothetical protein
VDCPEGALTWDGGPLEQALHHIRETDLIIRGLK